MHSTSNEHNNYTNLLPKLFPLNKRLNYYLHIKLNDKQPNIRLKHSFDFAENLK